MGFIIEDGEGNGNSVGVDTRKRIKSAAISESESDYATSRGLKYNINTGDITITDSTKLTVLYFKNNEDQDVIIDALVYNLGNSTGGTGDALIDVIRNPISGGIVSAALAPAVGIDEGANLNYGSSRTIAATIYKGAQGQSVITGGLPQILTRDANGKGRIFISPGGGVRLPKGASIAINYTPPASNSSQVVQFALNAYIKEIV